jgi:hypothetical protein
MHRTVRLASSLVAVLPILAACGGASEDPPSAPVEPALARVVVSGTAPDFSLAPIPRGSTEPSTANGTDFGTWTAGTLGQPFPPKLFQYELRNDGDEPVGLVGTPFVEVIGPDAVRFAVFDLCGLALEPGSPMTFAVSFDGMGEHRRHLAEVVVHLEGRDYTFAIAGTTVAPSGH